MTRSTDPAEGLDERQNGIRRPSGHEGADHAGHHHRHPPFGRVAVLLLLLVVVVDVFAVFQLLHVTRQIRLQRRQRFPLDLARLVQHCYY